ncbi:MAG: ATP-binding protein [Chloroflexota bacterium]
MTIESSLRLLYLEEQKTKHDAFKHTLEPLQYDVFCTNNARDALDLIAMRPFEMVAVSTKLAPITTLDFISTIQRWPRTPSILIMTEPGDEPIAAEALNLGASNYMVIDEQNAWLKLLPIMIQRIMRRHQLENEKREMLFTLQERNRALSYLNLVGADLTSILEPDQVMKRLMRYAIEILGAEGSSLWLWTDEKQTHLECKAVIHRTSTPPLKGVRMERGEGIVGWTGQNNRSTILNTVQTDNRFAKNIDSKINFSTMSLLAVPLRVRGEVFGVLEFVNKLVGQFEESDQSLAETLAHSAATALENARLVESLRQSKLVLQERNAELDAFGHTVAHDLQNMLARIIGFSEYLLQESDAGDDDSIPREVVAKAADVISRDSRKMSGVIEALMLLSAVRQAEVEVGPIDTKYLITETLDRLADRIESNNATIIFPDEWPVAQAYGPWIEEVWYNYIGNALKYGGENPEIELGATLQPDNKTIRFWVKDNGEGVPTPLQAELFRPFTDYGRNRKMGAGLGLSIVHRIVTRLNGTVGVQSWPDKGSTFWFSLPAVLNENVESDQPEQAPQVDVNSHYPNWKK